MIKVEDLTDVQLDVLVVEKVMKWKVEEFPDGAFCVSGNDGVIERWIYDPLYPDKAIWSPSTDPVAAFQVDKPEWRWQFDESTWLFGKTPSHPILTIRIVTDAMFFDILAHVELYFDPANRTAAYCRGICLCALKACGIKEVE